MMFFTLGLSFHKNSVKSEPNSKVRIKSTMLFRVPSGANWFLPLPLFFKSSGLFLCRKSWLGGRVLWCLFTILFLNYETILMIYMLYYRPVNAVMLANANLSFNKNRGGPVRDIKSTIQTYGTVPKQFKITNKYSLITAQKKKLGKTIRRDVRGISSSHNPQLPYWLKD